MRIHVFALIVLFPFLGCSQNSDPKLVVDHQGKELSEDEVRDFMKTEMERFENLNTPRKIPITKIDNVKKSLPDWFNISSDRFKGLNKFTVDDKLVNPYLAGKITAAEFLVIIDTLGDEVKRAIPGLFTRRYYPQLKQDRALLDKVLAIDKELKKNEDGLLIRATQQMDGFRKTIEDSIRSNTFHMKYYYHRVKYISRYAEGGDLNATFALLDIAVNKMPADKYLSTYDEHYLNPFEYLMLNGDAAMKQKTRKLLFDYLRKASTTAWEDVSMLLAGDVSADLKSFIALKRSQIDKLSDAKERQEQESAFYKVYLLPYTRISGMDAFPYLTNLIIDEGNAYEGFPALHELVRYTILTEDDKTKILDLLKKFDQKNGSGYYTAKYSAILKQIYPNKKASDFSGMFKDEYNEWTSLWNKPVYSTDSLDHYLSYLKTIGIGSGEMSPKERYLFIKENYDMHNEWLIFRLLVQLRIAHHYDCETGMWPNPYDELLEDYLKLSIAELKSHTGMFQFEKLNDDYATKYTALITDGKTGYLANPQDASDWYDPVTVETLLNRALKDNGTDKRFQQLATGDQTVFVVYCSPGQLKLMADKFGLPVLTESE